MVSLVCFCFRHQEESQGRPPSPEPLISDEARDLIEASYEKRIPKIAPARAVASAGGAGGPSVERANLKLCDRELIQSFSFRPHIERYEERVRRVIEVAAGRVGSVDDRRRNRARDQALTLFGWALRNTGRVQSEEEHFTVSRILCLAYRCLKSEARALFNEENPDQAPLFIERWEGEGPLSLENGLDRLIKSVREWSQGGEGAVPERDYFRDHQIDGRLMVVAALNEAAILQGYAVVVDLGAAFHLLRIEMAPWNRRSSPHRRIRGVPEALMEEVNVVYFETLKTKDPSKKFPFECVDDEGDKFYRNCGLTKHRIDFGYNQSFFYSPSGALVYDPRENKYLDAEEVEAQEPAVIAWQYRYEYSVHVAESNLNRQGGRGLFPIPPDL